MKNSLAKRTIRRSQIISIFGVGSIYLFKNQYSKTGDQDSLMLAGLDAWETMFENNKLPDEWKIFEPRLQARLNKEFGLFQVVGNFNTKRSQMFALIMVFLSLKKRNKC